MSKIEQGFNPTDQSLAERTEVPKVTRRGKLVAWNLPGNTPEQNEQLGIANIQALFLIRFPEFNDLFPRGEDGIVMEDKRKEAVEFITKKIPTREDFSKLITHSLFGSSRRSLRSSFTEIMVRSFSPWGLTVDYGKTARGYWKNLETIKDEARKFIEEHGSITQNSLKKSDRSDLSKAISRHYPGRLTQLKKDLGIGSGVKPKNYWTEDSIEREARKFVAEKGVLTQKALQESGRFDLISAMARYPGKMFGLKEKLGLKHQKIPYDQWTPEKIREKAMEFYKKKGRLSQYALVKNKESGFSIVIDRLYQGGIRQLRKDLGLEEVVKPEGYWTPENIEKEAIEILKKEGKLSNDILRRLKRYDLATAIQTNYPGKTEGLKRKIGIKSERKPRGYYTEEQMKKDAQAFLLIHGDFNAELLKGKKKTGFLAAIGKSYPGGMFGLRSELGLAQSGKPMGYWTPENIEKEALEFYKKEGSLTTTLLKKKGNPLASLISSKYPGGINALKSKLNIELSVYPQEYWDIERIEREAKDFCRETSHISEHFLEKAGRADLTYAIKKYYPGGLKMLRLRLDLKAPDRTVWTVEKIEEEAKEFYEAHRKISHAFLIRNKNRRLSSAISRSYPGGIVVLRSKLGITAKEEVIDPDQANAELMKLLEEKNE